jgi:hypothetical protein
LPTDGAVGVGRDSEDVLGSAFFLDCADTFARNSFCFASKEVTPSGVMSANAGDRKRGVLVLKARVHEFEALREEELLARRRANILNVWQRVFQYWSWER